MVQGAFDHPGGNFQETVGYTRLALGRDVQATERNRLSMHKWNWNLGVVEIAEGQFVEPRGKKVYGQHLRKE